MTHLKLYENALIEQNKLEAPPLLIEEYNYLINKAILQYINLTYARFDLNQQASDDLRWLQKSVELDIFKQNKLIPPMEDYNYMCVLPYDYLHILNCTVHFSGKCGSSIPMSKCKSANEDGLGGIFSLCRRLTANQFPAIIQNAYLKPTYKRPYYYINTSTGKGKISVFKEAQKILDPCDGDSCVEDSCWKGDLGTVLQPCENGECGVELCNCSDCNVGPIMEIRCGINKGIYPDVAYVDYLRKPEQINLTWDDVQSISDSTEECEFPDAVAYEIINIFMKLLFENAGDARLQTHYAINQTIGGVQQTSSTK